MSGCLAAIGTADGCNKWCMVLPGPGCIKILISGCCYLNSHIMLKSLTQTVREVPLNSEATVSSITPLSVKLSVLVVSITGEELTLGILFLMHYICIFY